MKEEKTNLKQTNRRRFLTATGTSAVGLAGFAGGLRGNGLPQAPSTSSKTSRSTHSTVEEPNLETAYSWWDELPDKWTPVGWKNHLFRFNVLFNGTIVAEPYLNRRTEEWKDQGVQLMVMPSGTGIRMAAFIERTRRRYPEDDDGWVIQGWNESPTPVLWSEWSWDGLVLREEIFAHIPEAKKVETGIEPLFAWIRLSIQDIVEGLPVDEKYGFAVKINAPHISHTMEMKNNNVFHPEQSLYPRPLIPEAAEYSFERGYRLLEGDGLVRLGVAPGQECSLSFKDREPTKRDALFSVQMDVQPGAHVDLLLPMVPMERGIFDSELALGYERALQEANGYWSQRPAAAASVETPEKAINQAIRHMEKAAEVIAERDPATAHASLLTGSWTYASVWATPTAMNSAMWLDNLGYHSEAAMYLEPFMREQGTVVPPGKSFRSHPGYLATPKSLTAINWLSDHGALLWAIAQHALISGDGRFVDRWMPTILGACDFVRDARRIKGHGGVAGIMPPAVATDNKTEIQAVWNDGWIYKGLVTAGKLLQRTNHSRADEFAGEALEYKQRFARTIREKARTMPQWTDAAGRKHRLVPTALSGATKAEMRHAFYLDTGPLFLVFAGLLEADDELMRSSLLWFREGPPSGAYRHDSVCWQVPSLVHEISSCEPCYSWNLFHSHQTGDRIRFLEGMYSLFAGAISRQTFTVCETRGGITGIAPLALALTVARLAVIDDQIVEGELHLLRLVPKAWLKRDHETRFEKVPTEFGPMTLRVKLDEAGERVLLGYDPSFRSPPLRVVLHVPPLEGLSEIVVNGHVFKADGKRSTIVIS